jgi:2-polyprenyl-3-methyl-5-hydroxy-6-metoxy-1,4-benzoquinol methylase
MIDERLGWGDPIDFYIDHASHFDVTRSRALDERGWLDAFLELIPPGGSVLDMGCGMGDPIAAYLLGQGRRVTGVDAVPALLDLASARLRTGEWIEADLRDLHLGRRFDGIIAWDSLFHLDIAAQRTCFATFAAHAAPGAALLFNSGTDEGESANPMFGEPLYHASLAADAYRDLLALHGFQLVRHVVTDTACGGRTIWLARAS